MFFNILSLTVILPVDVDYWLSVAQCNVGSRRDHDPRVPFVRGCRLFVTKLFSLKYTDRIIISDGVHSTLTVVAVFHSVGDAQ